MKGRKYTITLILLLLASAIAYLVWPLGSDEFEIYWDKEEIAFKRNHLLFQTTTHIKAHKPNILLIIVDDLGKTDITLYGAGKVNTPNIDRLGAEGVIFEQAYVTSPVCSPSRAAIMTGRYPQRYGFVYQMHEFYVANRLQYYGFKYLVDSYPWIPRQLEKVPDEEMAEKQGLPPSEITLTELLKKEGYATGLVGKWHLGVHNQNVPCNFGFDYQYGFYASHSLYASVNDPDVVGVRIPEDFSDQYIWKGKRNGPHAIYRNCEKIEEKAYLTNAITRECKNFIKAHADTSFFLIASYNAPHTPLQAPMHYVERFSQIDDPVKRVYYAMIACLDDAIGELHETLHALNIDNNTLIFFISDNGGATYTHTTDNHPLKGGKITDFEGGINVPFIMKWDGYFPEGLRYNNPVSSMDIFATITSALNIDLPKDRIYDGVDLIPYINNANSKKLPHDHLYWYRGNSRAIRSKNWKMVWNEEFGENALYNLKNGNRENKNVSDHYPQVVKGLKSTYDLWLNNMEDPLWPPLIYFVYEDGGEVYHFDN